MLWKMYLNVCVGFGSVIVSPQVLEFVFGGSFVARKFSLLCSLVTPCVRIEDRNGLCTVASVLDRIAGYSIRFRGGVVISSGSRSRSTVLSRGGTFCSAYFFGNMDLVLGRLCFVCFPFGEIGFESCHKFLRRNAV